jgi:ribosomal protein S12 methylthiotransferase accessory factor
MNDMSDLFRRAADALAHTDLAGPSSDAGDLLAILGYGAKHAEARHLRENQIALLRAAATFTRVFRLQAADAPGLVFLGGEVDPAQISANYAGSKLIGVGGMGQSVREAFSSCIGEGVEYLSQFESGNEAVIHSSSDEVLERASELDRPFLDPLLPARNTLLDVMVATGLLGDETLHFPADFCLRRSSSAQRINPPHLLSMGCAAGCTQSEAILHGLCELVERDAAGLWWRGGLRGRQLRLEAPGMEEAASYLLVLRQGVNRRRTWLLDITTDLEIPAVVAISCHADGRGAAFGFGAHLSLLTAAKNAIKELCQSELALSVVTAKLTEGGEERLNDRDRAHLARAARIDANAAPLLQPAGETAHLIPISPHTTGETIAELVRRLRARDICAYAIDLTRTAFAIPVARVVAPGLHIEPSRLSSPRLTRAIETTGGGESSTHGLPLF